MQLFCKMLSGMANKTFTVIRKHLGLSKVGLNSGMGLILSGLNSRILLLLLECLSPLPYLSLNLNKSILGCL